YIEKQIDDNIKPIDGSRLLVHKTGSHSGYLTYDGIDVNGKRIVDEILQQTKQISEQGDRVTKFSIIGYSLGGLISRYAIGILYAQGFFTDIQPINFVTFCTPHIGVLNPQTHNLSVRIYNYTAPLFLLVTGSQFFLKDKVGKHNKPLLVWMTDPNSKFYQALKNFKYRALYANVVNDKRCSWFTAAISSVDPVNSMYNKSAENIECEYIKGYEPNIIDSAKPFHYVQRKSNTQTPYENSKFSWLWKTLNWIKLIAYITALSPIWALSFIIPSIVQKIKSTFRLREFNNNKDNKLSHLYEYSEETSSLLTDFSNKMEDEQDTVVEDMYGAMSYRTSHSSKFPEIKLDPNQSYAVEKLNTLTWRKIPILLRNTMMTHAAAVVRHPDPTFDEGQVVIKHFVNEVFQLN
ncbi:putative lipase, partial [Acetobacter pasteurianus]|nr:putative lipase [Acetobacter pasteurianus]